MAWEREEDARKMSSFFPLPSLICAGCGTAEQDSKEKKTPCCYIVDFNLMWFKIEYAVPGIVQGSMLTVLLMVIGFNDMLG